MRTPIIIAKQAGIFNPIWKATKFMVKNPYARRATMGAAAGGIVGGTGKMMSGTVEDAGKNFLKGSLVGAGAGAAVGLGTKGYKALTSHKPVSNGIKKVIKAPKLRTGSAYKMPNVLSKTSGFWKNTKLVGKYGIPTALVGGSLLYWNNKLKKKQPSYLGEYYKYTAPALTYGERAHY